jgi:hypothetical protein
MPAGTECHCHRKLQGGLRATLTETHLLTCNGSKVMTTRHNAISNVIVDMIKSAKLAPIVEQLASEEHDARLRFDVSVDRINGWPEYTKCDITIVNPLSTHLVAKAANTPRSAADAKVAKKAAKYKPFLHQSDKFIPLVFETFGAVHPNVFHLVHTLSTRVGNQPPQSATWTAPTFTAYWMQRLSCCLWRENARSIASTVAMTKNAYKTGVSTSMDFDADFIPHQHQHHQQQQQNLNMRPASSRPTPRPLRARSRSAQSTRPASPPAAQVLPTQQPSTTTTEVSTALGQSVVLPTQFRQQLTQLRASTGRRQLNLSTRRQQVTASLTTQDAVQTSTQANISTTTETTSLDQVFAQQLQVTESVMVTETSVRPRDREPPPPPTPTVVTHVAEPTSNAC